MEALRSQGWHTGHWRDLASGQDNGVRRLLASTRDTNARRAGLHRIIRTLHDELRKIPNGIVTLWHDEITPDLLGADDVEVVEVSAASAEEAIAKLKESRNGQST
jgi:hypothetical protein